jgi:signal recognition particle GTPase
MNTKDLARKIHDLFIVREYDGSYNLFGKYTVHEHDGLYKVTVLNEAESGIFSNLKNAVTWCVFEKNNKYKEKRRLEELDELLASTDVSIAIHVKLVQKTEDMEHRSIYQAKLVEEKRKKRHIINEINNYIDLSKYMQRKKYHESGAN